ncbi:hypothetical protein PAXRUDRAFT_536199 [Paxillus rubicundulus Ve08.2h10]|uniref:BZIP domain-containing protein n=1 Tax=Paxillus rubicundulus Ve08.2h10 TaxID=930991 RepID=A0A0D0E075_9AGAM|nr:hypothetical protein PAXRUDRAFT_536199 [Paxillus rubicundulus Ve08.2h10]
MLVDDPLQQSFSFDPSNLDDFFNLDVLNATSQPSLGASGSQSSSSPRSPFSFTTMPLTPPPPAFTSSSFPQLSTADDAFFGLFLEDEFSKMPPLPPATSPYDFLSGMSAAGGPAIGIGASPQASSSTSPSAHPHSPQPMFSIDPQLVGTPATSKQEEEEAEEQLSQPLTKPDRSKTSRKGAVISGGVKKASSPAEKENGAKEAIAKDHAHLRILEPEDWRPSPEEYKKMSSKEKRQLRNKISARNFRVRRKEYITTLEGDIAERDRLIDAIRSELGSSKSENTALRQEITALKKCLLEGRGLPDLPPPAELPLSPPSPPPATASISALASSSSSVVTPNTQKDLPTSPRLGNRAFWGGLGGMGVTPVHTTFIPPIAVLASKASASSSSLFSGSPVLKPSIFYEETIRPRVLQENLNPALNPSSYRSLIEKKGAANLNPALSNLNAGTGAFDSFTDTNPFTFKTLDAYRMQLWGKMAAQQQAFQHQPQPQQTQGQMHTPPYSPYSSPTGLAGNLKPHYFTSAQRVGGTSPKATPVAGAYPTPPTSQLPSQVSTSREQVAIAALASQTLLGKLGSAFWEAFSGSPSSSIASSSKQWDAEKVRKVLEGRAVVKVVDVEPTPARVHSPVPAFVMPSSPASSSVSGSSQLVKAESCKCKEALTDILEESMRSLTLGKK